MSITSPMKEHNPRANVEERTEQNTSKVSTDSQFLVKNKVNIEAEDHLEFLFSCFREQIGIPMQSSQKREINNFDGVLIAKGFNRVVGTYQGLFWEIDHDDVAFWNLNPDLRHTPGVKSWSTKGVRVFKLTTPDKRTRPKQHRFAVNPPSGFRGPCNPLKVGMYYAHIYQTKVKVEENSWRTLRSKRMAIGRYKDNF